MLSRVIKVGDKIELQPTNEENDVNAHHKKIYFSTVFDIMSDSVFEITMPIEQRKWVPLPVGGEYTIVFYEGDGLYQCVAKVTNRYKTGNVYVLMMEMKGKLQKCQRREYFRYDCLIEMAVRQLQQEEITKVETELFYELRSDLPTEEAVIADISGGGMRFVANRRYEPDSILRCVFCLEEKEKKWELEVMCKILRIRELENRKGTFEHRAIFYYMNESLREKIIKWIFEAERRGRQRSGLS